MGKSYVADITFPMAGLDRAGPYRQQKPYTTADAANVLPQDTEEARDRGGSRPCLVKRYPTEIGSGEPVRFIQQLYQARSSGFTAWSDDFDQSSIGSVWSTASWIGVIPPVMASLSPSIYHAEVGAVRDTLDIDTDETYSVSMYCVPYSSKWDGYYRIHLRMDDTTPDASDDGVTAELYMYNTSGAYSGTLTCTDSGVDTDTSFTAGNVGSVTSGWLEVVVSGNSIKVYWQGTLVASTTAHAAVGKRVGFSLKCVRTGGACCIDIFRVKHYTASTNPTDILIASSNGEIWRNNAADSLLTKVVASGVSSDKLLQTAVRGSKCFIADLSSDLAYGTDGQIAADGVTLTSATVSDWTALGISTGTHVAVISDALGSVTAGTYKLDSVSTGSIKLAASTGGSGTCTFQITRPPSYYDPSDDSLNMWIANAGKGQVPCGCHLICTYRDRLVLAGPNYEWYMSRQGDPFDWDYSADAGDAGRAVAGIAADAGQLIADPLKAIAPFRDDFLVLGCRNSLWVLRGDATFGGQIDSLSREIGMVAPQGWTWGPSGELYFLSMDGIYLLEPNAQGVPQRVSGNRIPRELINVNPSLYYPLMRYDAYSRGIHIFVTPVTAEGSASTGSSESGTGSTASTPGSGSSETGSPQTGSPESSPSCASSPYVFEVVEADFIDPDQTVSSDWTGSDAQVDQHTLIDDGARRTDSSSVNLTDYIYTTTDGAVACFGLEDVSRITTEGMLVCVYAELEAGATLKAYVGTSSVPGLAETLATGAQSAGFFQVVFPTGTLNSTLASNLKLYLYHSGEGFETKVYEAYAAALQVLPIPLASDSSTQWTPADGLQDNYENVDDLVLPLSTPSLDEYVSSDTVGYKDIYTITCPPTWLADWGGNVSGFYVAIYATCTGSAELEVAASAAIDGSIQDVMFHPIDDSIGSGSPRWYFEGVTGWGPSRDRALLDGSKFGIRHGGVGGTITVYAVVPFLLME